MNSIEETDSLNESKGINDEIKEYLLETAKWVNFLAIMGFVGVGIMLLFALFLSFFGAHYGAFAFLGSMNSLVGPVYFILAVVYFFPVYYLYNAAEGIKNGLLYRNQDYLTSGFRNFKSHFKFRAILTIVIIGSYFMFMAGFLVYVIFLKSLF